MNPDQLKQMLEILTPELVVSIYKDATKDKDKLYDYLDALEPLIKEDFQELIVKAADTIFNMLDFEGELDAHAREYYIAVADNAFLKYSSYVEAGFTSDQAMALLLNIESDSSSIISSISKAISEIKIPKTENE